MLFTPIEINNLISPGRQGRPRIEYRIVMPAAAAEITVAIMELINNYVGKIKAACVTPIGHQ